MIATWLLAGLLAQAPTAVPPTDAAPLIVGAVGTDAPTADAAPALTDLDRLRVTNHSLRLRLAQVETQLLTRELSDERAALDAALRAAYPEWAMDWTTGRLTPVPTDGDQVP